MKSYYTLIEFNTELKKWFPVFGSYDMEDVIEEKDDYEDDSVYGDLYEIIPTGDTQADIDQTVAFYNKTYKPL